MSTPGVQLKDLKAYVNDGVPDVFVFTISSLRVSCLVVYYGIQAVPVVY